MAEKAKNLYIIIMIALFPLYVDGDYSSITTQKSAFLLIAFGLSFFCYFIFARKEQLEIFKGEKNWQVPVACLVALLLMGVSTLHSNHPTISCFSDRGWFLHACYFLSFLMLATTGSWRPFFAHAVSAASGLSALIVTLQICGYNPLFLFPGDLTYHDAYTRYTGEYLGTIGNVDIFSVWLIICVAITAGSLICETTKKGIGFNIAGLLCAVYCGRIAGTDGFTFALLATFFIVPLCVANSLSRTARWGSSVLFAAGAWEVAEFIKCACVNEISPPTGKIIFSLILFALGIFIILCVEQTRKKNVMPKVFENFEWQAAWGIAILLCAGILILLIYSLPPAKTEGTLYEIHRILHGEILPSFGSSRIQIWQKSFHAIKQAPLFGNGEPFPEYVSVVFSKTLESGKETHAYVADAHNIILSLLVHYGFIPTLALAGIVFLVVRKSIVASDGARICTAAMLGFIAAEQTCVSDFLVTPIFWTLAGIACAECLLPQSKGTHIEEKTL